MKEPGSRLELPARRPRRERPRRQLPILRGILGFSLLAGCSLLSAVEPDAAKAPPTRAEDVSDTYHGVQIRDPYRWLEDQDSPETRAWIDAQNAYTDSVLGQIPGRDAIQRRLTELLRVDVVGIPTERAGRYFFSKRRADQDLAVLYVRRTEKGKDEVLVDPHPLSTDHRTSVTYTDISADGRLAGYGIRKGGEDELTLKFFEVDHRRELADVLPRARYLSVTLLPDRSGVYYAKQTEEGPRVFLHRFGTEPSRDRKIFGDGYGPDKIIDVEISEDGRFLTLVVYYGSAAQKTDVFVSDLAGGGTISPIVTDLDARFEPNVAGHVLYLLTNWVAPRGRVLRVDLEHPQRERWRETVPQQRASIEAVSVVGGRVFVHYLDDVVGRLKVFTAEGRLEREISFPSLGSIGEVRGRWGSSDAFFSFTSFHIPTTIYRYRVAKSSQSVWARLHVPIDSDRFELEQVHYASKDGTRIPMFLLHQKGIELDGSHPTLLTGYGGFNLSETPAFSARAAIWVEAGGVFALPNLRGGGEFGEEWHRAGMLSKKQNVFDDFIAAAEWLIGQGYTRPEKLAISGGSNGGLLVGAALTQRPELFGAVVCSYPLLDMLRYQKFLVAGYWVPEYGSSESAEQFEYLRRYSPYQNVRPGTKYPAVLLISGDSDTRVAPLHARKMTALLQASTGAERPILLHYDTKAGHSGGMPVSKQIEDLTDELSFLFGQTGASYEPVRAKPPAKKKAA